MTEARHPRASRAAARGKGRTHDAERNEQGESSLQHSSRRSHFEPSKRALRKGLCGPRLRDGNDAAPRSLDDADRETDILIVQGFCSLKGVHHAPSSDSF